MSSIKEKWQAMKFRFCGGEGELTYISGKSAYRIVRAIAVGGMGAVYEAKQIGVEGFEKTVAIKTLNKRVFDDPKFTKMFIEEAKLVANLVHENIVQIYQLEQEKKMYYFVMEYVDGTTLHDIMNYHREAGKQLPIKLAVFIASRIARGLGYAHGRVNGAGRHLKIVHCDVCCRNILVSNEGLPKLSDFGIAKAVTSKLNTDDDLMGKLLYMSPEQVTGENLDHRSDLYSLGVVLFLMLTNSYTRKEGGSVDELLKQAEEGVINWEPLCGLVDDDLVEIVKKMLARDATKRFEETSELAKALEYYIYKDGYGPTIVTLSDYLKTEMSGHYKENSLTNLTTRISKTRLLRKPKVASLEV